MLQIKHIKKEYVTGELTQTALNGVSLNFRDNEFVAILGPSGSGKTTLLNIIGGLDRYDSGDLIINGISTKKYKDRDWDSYRNHTIGFVFQSYNLIPHQTVLSNVELALTISGISKSERRQRAKTALEKVGLGDQLHKKPNQMSGGQMQRVAIARALVNDPDILLADEPTGALDSETSVQVMELLNEVAKDRLVIMVTHNPELAEEYATRIVKLKDGNITDDSDPYEVDEGTIKEPEHKNMGKSSMSPVTALSLSFNNLRTKKGRTLLTSFAGSIGIIGIALILSLSNGVNTYIEDLQKNTMSSYPISIEEQSMDMSAMMSGGGDNSNRVEHDADGVYVDTSGLTAISGFTASINTNNLAEFKNYLDDPESEIHQYIGENGIIYSYNTKFDVYSYDDNGTLVNTDGSTLTDTSANSSFGMMISMGMSGGMTGSSGNANFSELMTGADGELISPAISDNYDIVYGRMPEAYNELVLVVDEYNTMDAATLYQLGILPTADYREIYAKLQSGEDVKVEIDKLDYADICAREFYFIPQCDYYEKNSKGLYDDVSGDTLKVKALLENAEKLTITGIIKPVSDKSTSLIDSAVGYTAALTDHFVEYTNNNDAVKAQTESKEINVLNGMAFEPADDQAKIADVKKYVSSLDDTAKAGMFQRLIQTMPVSAQSDPAENASVDPAEQLVSFIETADDSTLLGIYDSYISAGTYYDTLSDMGVIDLSAPSAISIYADSFEDKEAIQNCIEEYNKTVNEEDQISYTDFVGMITSSVTTIVDVISYVLIAFVAVSLIVSSLMIGIITYISVLERTKEIGILRAIGASKRNISQVFNAETFIIGLCSGLIGVIITMLLLIPANAVIHSAAGIDSVNASLPVLSAVILVILSILLTLIGGLIPSRKAAKKDPVTALRTE